MKISQQEEELLTVDEAKGWLLVEVEACRHHHVTFKEHRGGPGLTFTGKIDIMKVVWCPECARVHGKLKEPGAIDVFVQAVMPLEKIEFSMKIDEHGATLDEAGQQRMAAEATRKVDRLLESRFLHWMLGKPHD